MELTHFNDNGRARMVDVGDKNETKRVSIACLTIYDMCKAIDKKMVIGDIKLIKKTGGKSNFNLGE